MPLVGLLWGLAFCVLLTYGVARAAIESIFLSHHASKGLPSVWLAVAVTIAGVVWIYNRVAARAALGPLTGWACAAFAIILGLLLVALRADVPGAAFALYVFKDVYIVVLVELFWTLANSTYDKASAAWLYGSFSLLGGLGDMTGNLLVGPLAAAWGTEGALALVIPLLAPVGILGVMVGRRAGGAEATALRPAAASPSPHGVIRKSAYLGWMVALIAVVQIVITLVDFQYNAVIESAFPEQDARTGVIGKVYAVISAGSMALHLLTGPILAYAGVGLTLIGVPVGLGLALAGFAGYPGFVAMAVVKVYSKAFDYSLFRAAKELLYLPLGRAEKVAGKAIVDMMTYRVAKGGAAALLLLFVWAGVDGASLAVTAACGALLGAWIAVTAVILRRYQRVLDDQAAGPRAVD